MGCVVDTTEQACASTAMNVGWRPMACLVPWTLSVSGIGSKKCHCNGNGGVTAESDVKGRSGLCNLIQVVPAVGARDTVVTGRGCKGGLRFSWIVDWAGIPDYRAYRWLRVAYQ